MDPSRVYRTLRVYEIGVSRALRRAAKGDPDALSKASAYQGIVLDIKQRALREGLDLGALRKAHDPDRRAALLAAMARDGETTFEGKVSWVRRKLEVADPVAFVGWLVQGEHDMHKAVGAAAPALGVLAKAHKLHGRIAWKGLQISIENAKGTTRDWYNPDTGESGGSYLPQAYGYIRDTVGADGEHLDVIVGPHLQQATSVYLVRQRKAPDFVEYDEDKVLIGFASMDDAKAAYWRQYDNPRYMGDWVYSMSVDAFVAGVKQHKDTPPLTDWDARMVDQGHCRAQQRPASLQTTLAQALRLGSEPEDVQTWSDLLSKAAKVGVGHRYLRRVPTGNPKRPWRYYYTAGSIGRGVSQGESVLLGHRHVQIGEVDHEGLTIHDEGKTTRLTMQQWHDLMAEHHGEAYVAAVDKRVRGYAAAVYRHVPRELLSTCTTQDELRERAPEVYRALAKAFQRVGVGVSDARGMVAWSLSRQGWDPDARAVLLGAGISLEHGAQIARDYKGIGQDAILSAAQGQVRAKNVADVLVQRGLTVALPAEPVVAAEVHAPPATQAPAKVAAEAGHGEPAKQTATAPYAEATPSKRGPAVEPMPEISEEDPPQEDVAPYEGPDIADKAVRDPHTGAYDIGEHIPMARRERWWLEHGAALRAALLGPDALSLAEAETAGVAKRVVSKKMLLGAAPDPDDLRIRGFSAGGAYVLTQIHDALGAAPPDTPVARQAYTDIVRSLWLVTQNAKTPADIAESLKDYWETWKAQPHRDASAKAKSAVESEHETWMQRVYPASDSRKQEDNAIAEMDLVIGKRLTSLIMSAAGVHRNKRQTALETARAVFSTAERLYDKHRRVVAPGHIGTDKEMRDRRVYGAPGVGYTAAGEHFKRSEEAFAAARKLRLDVPRYEPSTSRYALPDETFKFGDRGQAVGPDGQPLPPVSMPPEHQDWSWAAPAEDTGDSAAKPVTKPKGRGVKMLTPTEPAPGRKGPEAPDGTDPDIMSRFGVRGVQHGNYMTEADRTHHGRQAFVALHDLTQVLDLPDSVVSYNGRLGLAFGARGSGRALAHYEGSLQTINITRDKGGGTLAHEWGHFLDHMLGSQADHKQLSSVFASDMAPEGFAEDADRKLQSALAGVMQAITQAPVQADDAKERLRLRYAARRGSAASKKEARDQIKTFGRTEYARHAVALGSYWERGHELFARAFEAYVADKLQDKGQENGYLVNHPQQAEPYGVRDNGEYLYAYPRGAERVRIKAAFDTFFGALKGHGILAKAFGLPADWTDPPTD